MDRSNLLEQFLALLDAHQIRFCVIGGQAVNAYVEPVVSLDLDLVIAAEQLDALTALLSEHFVVRRYPFSLHVSMPDSDLRIQLQTDPRYMDFVQRALLRDVLGLILPVAQLEDLVRGKVWAVQDTERRPSKRQKDLADLARLLEAHPSLADQIPQEILDRLI